MSVGSPMPEPRSRSPHVASGRSQTTDSLGRVIASGIAVRAK